MARGDIIERKWMLCALFIKRSLLIDVYYCSMIKLQANCIEIIKLSVIYSQNILIK